MRVFHFDPAWQQQVNRKVWRSITAYSLVAVATLIYGIVEESWIAYGVAAFAVITAAVNYFTLPMRKAIIESHSVEVTDIGLVVSYRNVSPVGIKWSEIKAIKENSTNGQLNSLKVSTTTPLGDYDLEGLSNMKQLAGLIHEKSGK